MGDTDNQEMVYLKKNTMLSKLKIYTVNHSHSLQ